MRSINKLVKLAHIFEYKLLSLANNDNFNDDEVKHFTFRLRALANDLRNKKILSVQSLFKAINTIKHQLGGTKHSTASNDMPLSKRIERDRQRFSSSLNMIADLISAKRTGKKQIIKLLDYLLDKIINEKYITEEESENFGRICQSCGLEKDIVADNKCQECFNEDLMEGTEDISSVPFHGFHIGR